MAREYTLTVNTADCVGCYACEVACKQAHDLPPGPRLISVSPDSPKEIDGRLQLRYIVTHCRHCSQSPCQEACPTEAITTREDGIVLLDQELCTGCLNCLEACPFDAIQPDEVNKVAQKCDLCADRVDRGLPPACVAACPARCIHFSDKKTTAGLPEH